MNNIKNLKVRLLSLLTALTLAGTPVIGKAESENSDGKEEKAFTLVKQEKKTYPLTMEEFALGVEKAYNEVAKHISYGDKESDKRHLLQQVECVYYLVNHSYMSDEVDKELIDNEIVFETDCSDMGGMQNFIEALGLLNVRKDYNQSMVRNTENINDTVDLSAFCYDENDAELVREAQKIWFESHKNNTFNMEAFEEVFKIITTLNGTEQKSNAFELSVGARWLLQLELGQDVMQVLRDYLQENYSSEELYKYFKREELNRAQWIIRDDLSLDLNCLSELEAYVVEFGELWKFCLTDVNKDIFKSFDKSCVKAK